MKFPTTADFSAEPETIMNVRIRGRPRGRVGRVRGSAGQFGQLVDCGPDVIPFALTLDVMQVDSGVAECLHHEGVLG
jgi:hypothetical protein